MCGLPLGTLLPLAVYQILAPGVSGVCSMPGTARHLSEATMLSGVLSVSIWCCLGKIHKEDSTETPAASCQTVPVLAFLPHHSAAGAKSWQQTYGFDYERGCRMVRVGRSLGLKSFAKIQENIGLDSCYLW